MLKKLSLAAVIAASGVSFASATPLTEAIKNVDLGGYLRYRYTHKNKGDDAKGKSVSVSHEYKAVVKFTIPVDEKLKLATKFVNKKKVSDSAGDADSHFKTEEMYLQYTGIDNLTLKAGHMSMKSPLTDADDYGTGALACYKINDNTALTVGGFSSANVTTGKLNGSDIALAGLNAKIEMLNLKAFYYHVYDVIDSAYFVEAKGAFGPVSVIAQYAYKDPKEGKSQDFAGVALAGNVQNVSATLAYLNFGKDGAGVEVGSDDSSLLKAGEQAGDLIGTSKLADGNAIAAVVSTKVNGFGVGADVVLVKDAVGGKDAKEYVIRASKKYSKKLKIKAYYSILDADIYKDNHTKGRLEVKYSF